MKHFLIIQFLSVLIILLMNLILLPNFIKNEIEIMQFSLEQDYLFEEKLLGFITEIGEKELGQTTNRVFVKLAYENYFNYMCKSMTIYLTIRIYNSADNSDNIFEKISIATKKFIDTDGYLNDKYKLKIILNFNNLKTIVKDV